MDKQIREAFGQIHAEEELKERTKAFLRNQTAPQKPPLLHRRLIPVLACLLAVFLLSGVHTLLLTPVGVVSVDVNPSLELKLNRLDRVLFVEGYNEEGELLAKGLSLRFVHYLDALEQLLSAEDMAPYLETDAPVTVTVLGKTEEKSVQMQAAVESDPLLTGKKIRCACGSEQEAAQARKAGLSLGKYRAYLELKKIRPDISVEEVKGLSMREIRDLARADEKTGTETNAHEKGQPRRKGQRQKNGFEQTQEQKQRRGQGRQKGKGHGGPHSP